MFNQSCEIPPQALEQQPKTGFEDMPVEKIEAMRAYGIKLRKKFPHMKEDRLMRKVAEHFKIKLV